MKKIVITKNCDVFCAHFDGDSSLTGFGDSEAEAIGKLIQNHGVLRGIVLERP